MSSTPTEYERQANFTSFESSNPSTPKPGSDLDAEFNAVKTAIDATQSRLAEIQREDGALANGVVTSDSLDATLTAALSNVLEDSQALIEAVDAAEASATAAAASVVTAAASAGDAASAEAAASLYANSSADSANASDTSAAEAAASAIAADASADAAAASLASMQATGGVSTAMLADGAVTAAKAANGMIVGRGYGEYTANADITTQIPSDDTIPQNTEGVEIITATITPQSTTNRIRARFNGAFVSNTTGSNVTVALFKDSDASAIAARTVSAPVLNYHTQIALEFEHVPGTTSAVTYKIRIGPGAAHTVRMNGSTSGRQLGGVSRATLVLEEIKA